VASTGSVRRYALYAWAACCALLGTAALAAESQGDAQRGQLTYLRVGCYECHGTRGAGGGIAGPAIVPRLIPIEVFTAQLRNPVRDMPPYEAGLLSDQDVKDLYAYLLSIPEGRRVSQIPELNR
jgi:mono/diheme cytochrome c family protein